MNTHIWRQSSIAPRLRYISYSRCIRQQQQQQRPNLSHSPHTQADVPPTIPKPQRKQIDLRPGPLKQPTSPPKINPAPIPTQNTVLPSSLQAAKLSAQEDIQAAVSHGVLKPPPKDANWLRKLIHQGWELAKFYGRGVKLILVHRGTVSEIKARVRKGGPPLTRAEYRFIQTYNQDITKLVPFVIIALLLEEVIPLIALYAPSMLPSTCILPSQRDRIHATKEAKATVYADEFKKLLERISRSPSNFMQHNDDALVMCGVLRLPTWGPNLLKKRRISKHLTRVAKDDGYLLSENRGMNLNEADLVEALEERGFLVTGLSMSKRQEHLRWWLHRVENTSDADVVPWRISSAAAAISRTRA